MDEPHTKNSLHLSGNAMRAQHDEALLRFGRRLDRYQDVPTLLQAMPMELGSITACRTTALLYQHEGTLA